MAGKAAQEFVPIKEVRDGFVVLRDGSLRAVLMASSINFALKSEDEQQAVLAQFQSFLNTLDFPVQIFVQSREQDIRPYIAMLEERYKEQTSDLMRIQTREYIDFIKSFTEAANIMTKNFFIIVPYSAPAFERSETAAGKVLSYFKKPDADKQAATSAEAFAEHRSQLEQRVSVVQTGMIRTGIRLVQLGTEEVIELFYKQFNPGELDKPITQVPNQT